MRLLKTYICGNEPCRSVRRLFDNSDLTYILRPDASPTETLQQHLDWDFQNQIVDGARCPRCKTTQEVRWHHQVIDAPEVLVLAARRFNMPMPGKPGVFEKDKTIIPFDEDTKVDLTTYLSPEFRNRWPRLTYSLKGVILHRGDLNVGHYTAVVRHDGPERKWFYINDQRVVETQVAEHSNPATCDDFQGYTFMLTRDDLTDIGSSPATVLTSPGESNPHRTNPIVPDSTSEIGSLTRIPSDSNRHGTTSVGQGATTDRGSLNQARSTSRSSSGQETKKTSPKHIKKSFKTLVKKDRKGTPPPPSISPLTGPDETQPQPSPPRSGDKRPCEEKLHEEREANKRLRTLNDQYKASKMQAEYQEHAARQQVAQLQAKLQRLLESSGNHSDVGKTGPEFDAVIAAIRNLHEHYLIAQDRLYDICVNNRGSPGTQAVERRTAKYVTEELKRLRHKFQIDMEREISDLIHRVTEMSNLLWDFSNPENQATPTLDRRVHRGRAHADNNRYRVDRHFRDMLAEGDITISFVDDRIGGRAAVLSDQTATLDQVWDLFHQLRSEKRASRGLQVYDPNATESEHSKEESEAPEADLEFRDIYYPEEELIASDPFIIDDRGVQVFEDDTAGRVGISSSSGRSATRKSSSRASTRSAPASTQTAFVTPPSKIGISSQVRPAKPSRRFATPSPRAVAVKRFTLKLPVASEAETDYDGEVDKGKQPSTRFEFPNTVHGDEKDAADDTVIDLEDGRLTIDPNGTKGILFTSMKERDGNGPDL